jgi:hypothetical protein
MKHARPDYDRIQDPAGLIPIDEPVLLFRGQDRYASQVARFYADLVEKNGGDREIVLRVRAHADRMDAWPKKKSPDITAAQACEAGSIVRDAGQLRELAIAAAYKNIRQLDSIGEAYPPNTTARVAVSQEEFRRLALDSLIDWRGRQAFFHGVELMSPEEVA